MCKQYPLPLPLHSIATRNHVECSGEGGNDKNIQLKGDQNPTNKKLPPISKGFKRQQKKTSFLSVSCSVLSPHLALMLEHAAGVTANSRMPLSYILLALLTSF